MGKWQDGSAEREFRQAAWAAGFVCVDYASDGYKGPAVKCLLEQVEALRQATSLSLKYEQWDERYVMVYPE